MFSKKIYIGLFLTFLAINGACAQQTIPSHTNTGWRDCTPPDYFAPRELTDPELLPLLNTMPSDMAKRTLDMVPQIRADYVARRAKREANLPSKPEDNVIAEERHIPGIDGEPPGRVFVYTPKGESKQRPVLLSIHGGSFILGTPDINDMKPRQLAEDYDAVIVILDYRLAPEQPYPAAINDSYAALKWIYQNAEELSIDRDRIVISGASAGGGLAASLALMARDKGEIPVAAQLLIYPSIDDRTGTALDPSCIPGTESKSRFSWQAYLGEAAGTEDVSPYAAPARAENLEGLPPTFIAVGTVDYLIREDMIFAKRLIEAGVPTELHVYPGAFHGFNAATRAQVSQQFERDFSRALNRAFKK